MDMQVNISTDFKQVYFSPAAFNNYLYIFCDKTKLPAHIYLSYLSSLVELLFFITPFFVYVFPSRKFILPSFYQYIYVVYSLNDILLKRFHMPIRNCIQLSHLFNFTKISLLLLNYPFKFSPVSSSLDLKCCFPKPEPIFRLASSLDV